MAERILAGRYRLLTKLGEGGMGSVWRAEHLELNSIVALKLIDPTIASTPAALARFKQEAQAAASLRSPNVVQILDYGVDTSDALATPFIAMECLEGESLGARLGRLGRLDPASTFRIMNHVGRAMARAHESGIVHRDLKPDNIFLVHNDDEEVAKVLDFGIAKRQQPHGSQPGLMTHTGAVMGTPYYMSPEQATAQPVDHRTDQWSLAVIVFECLVGRRPFDADNMALLMIAICKDPPPVPSRFGPVPQGFDAWFLRGVATNPANRFASVREMVAELGRVCASPTVTGPAHDATILASHGVELTPNVVPAHSGPELSRSQPTPMAQTVGDVAKPASRAWVLVVAAVVVLGIGTAVLLTLQRAPVATPEAPSSAVAAEAPPVAAPPPVVAPAPAVSPLVAPIASAPAPAPAAIVEPATPAHAGTPVRGRPPSRVAAPARPGAPPAAAPPAAPPVAAAPAPTRAPPPSASARLDSDLGI